MTKLEITERVVKWLVAIAAIWASVRYTFKMCKKAYYYLMESHERYNLLLSIIDNQHYEKVKTEAIMNKISLGYFVTDLEGKTVEVGDVVCKIFGKTEEELKTYGWSEFVHPEDRKWVIKYVVEATKYGRNGDLRYRIITESGDEKKVHVTAKKAVDRYFCTLEVIK